MILMTIRNILVLHSKAKDQEYCLIKGFNVFMFGDIIISVHWRVHGIVGYGNMGSMCRLVDTSVIRYTNASKIIILLSHSRSST
jgi:hypothetical protein